jgi:hypothetical protein
MEGMHMANKQNQSTGNQTDDVVNFEEASQDIAQYLDEVATGNILKANKTDGSIKYYPDTKPKPAR